jgi:glycosyltransferase involved in cell wall biosynthesis
LDDFMEMSVIIPCRGHAQMLGQCLHSVTTQQTSFEYEVIVVDSACDEAVAAATQQHARVKLVRSAEPLVAGRARNLGVQHAQGRCVAFIDADCVAAAGWLAAAHLALQEAQVRMVGGPVTDLLPGHWIASADNLLQFMDLPMTRPPGPARYFPTCNLAMRREDFATLGAFVDTHMNGGEDILLCDEALRRWPNSLRFEPGMAVQHTGRTTWGGYLAHHEFFGYCRATHRLHVRAWHLRWGRHAAVLPLTTVKRLAYVLQSAVRYRGWGAWRVLALLGLLLPGLWYSARGFRRGCREIHDGA